MHSIRPFLFSFPILSLSFSVFQQVDYISRLYEQKKNSSRSGRVFEVFVSETKKVNWIVFSLALISHIEEEEEDWGDSCAVFRIVSSFISEQCAWLVLSYNPVRRSFS